MAFETKYYEPELDLDGTADELFVQARNGYIEDPQALAKLQEILSNPLENKGEKARYVGFIKEREEQKDLPYSVGQFKKDAYDEVGSDEVTIRDGLVLEVRREREDILITLTETDNEKYPESGTGIGAYALPVEKFYKLTQEEFEQYVNSIYMYDMQEV